jgi:alanyl-tRNA synthetase
MKPLSAREIREQFLAYFASQQHRVCPSYPLVPPNDPTLLFTNAGMVQFKDVFTGKEKKDFRRAASSQKCVRAGGKHNDLENVGFTARHHTFFEMLGNFSFGDYFKREAIRFAWDFLVGRMQLPVERLYVTVFGGELAEGLPPDEEAVQLWREETGIAPDRILRFGKKDNFWSMGDVGPCGPCSEIHFDQGEAVPCREPGGHRGVGCECDRVMEVWNLVFMQFERHSDGRLTPLPAPSIDTGMGLERLAAIMQGARSNYDSDLFRPLLLRAGELAGARYGADPGKDASLRVIADHARAAAFLIADGVLPGNEGRGYVLRRIMRRAIRHGSKLGIEEPFFFEVCLAVSAAMGAHYPELTQQAQLIEKAARLEEETFRRTLSAGLKTLMRAIERDDGRKILDGKLVFDLQAQDGFPPDLTAVIAREHGFSIDDAGYRQAFERHQQVSGQGLGLTGVDEVYKELLSAHGPTVFVGYDTLATSARVLALLESGERAEASEPSRSSSSRPVERAGAGRIVDAVLDQTSCYGESGGQVGDKGTIEWDGGRGEILDTLRPVGELFLHRMRIVQGTLAVGQAVRVTVDGGRRDAIRRNHSATHLLQEALRSTLGRHVNQKGSLVAPDRLRFDFSHTAPLCEPEIAKVEDEVNRLIRANHPVDVEHTSLEAARQAGATMLFGEKYQDRVRMVRMGASLELCGGTHVARTGDVGAFFVLSESAVQSGVRRIEAVTGEAAIQHFQALRAQQQRMAEALRCPPAEAPARLAKNQERMRELEREIEQLKAQRLLAGGGSDPLAKARVIGEARALALSAEGVELKGLREFADNLRDRLGRGAVLAAATQDGKVSFACSVSKDLAGRLNAGQLLKDVLQITGGKGGGRPDFAQGGGGDPARLPEALEGFYAAVGRALGASG